MAMNKTLRLKGKLQTKGAQRPGAPTLPSRATVTTANVEDKITQLKEVRAFWQKEKTPVSPLVEVHYRTVVAKSNRIRQLLAGPKKKPNDYIVGAYFETVDGRQCHVITYYVNM